MKRLTLSVETGQVQPAGWMQKLTGRGAMRSPSVQLAAPSNLYRHVLTQHVAHVLREGIPPT